MSNNPSPQKNALIQLSRRINGLKNSKGITGKPAGSVSLILVSGQELFLLGIVRCRDREVIGSEEFKVAIFGFEKKDCKCNPEELGNREYPVLLREAINSDNDYQISQAGVSQSSFEILKVVNHNEDSIKFARTGKAQAFVHIT